MGKTSGSSSAVSHLNQSPKDAAPAASFEPCAEKSSDVVAEQVGSAMQLPPQSSEAIVVSKKVEVGSSLAEVTTSEVIDEECEFQLEEAGWSMVSPKKSSRAGKSVAQFPLKHLGLKVAQSRHPGFRSWTQFMRKRSRNQFKVL